MMVSSCLRKLGVFLGVCLFTALLSVYAFWDSIDLSQAFHPKFLKLIKIPVPATTHTQTPWPAFEDAAERQDRLQLLAKVAKLLAVGHRYARSSKTIKSLEEAYLLLSGFLKKDRVPSDLTLWQNQSLEPNESIAVIHNRTVCPEVWKGSLHGYPLYYEGHVVEDCDYGQNISDLVTIVLTTPHSTEVLNRILSEHSDIPVLMATYNSTDQTNNSNIITVPFEKSEPEGAILNKLLSLVTTTYALIARGGGFVFFDDNSRLHRLIRLIEYTDASVVGGSHRNKTGHWKIGCYQTKMRNYALRLVEGYDLAHNSCVYCDYVSGPVLAKTALFQDAFTADLSGDFLFLDLFSRWIDKTIAVCPDSMFFTEKLSQLEGATASEWLPFVKKWDLNKVVLPNRSEVALKCSDLKPECRKDKGMITHLCCLKELSDMLKLLSTFCETSGISCEIEAGTTVGAVKLYGILLWERDADLTYLAWNHTILKSLIPEFKKAGYNLTDEEVPNCKPVNEGYSNCGYWGLRSAYWRIELWGVNQRATRRLSEKGLDVPTKVLIDGQWITSYPNPAMYSRNRYGDDIYEHAEHWGTLGHNSSWDPYKTGSFSPCPTPGHHACLDQFSPVGNLQFSEVWL